MGGQAIVEALRLLEKGELKREKQDDSKSCYAKLIKKEMGKIDFNESAAAVSRLVRAFNPWPSAYTFLSGKQLKIWDAKPLGDSETTDELSKRKVTAGEIVEVSKDSFIVATGEGFLRVSQIQPEGKKRMSVRDYLNGASLSAGMILG
jgi:methionyl-tRNA formyltransferase